MELTIEPITETTQRVIAGRQASSRTILGYLTKPMIARVWMFRPSNQARFGADALRELAGLLDKINGTTI